MSCLACLTQSFAIGRYRHANFIYPINAVASYQFRCNLKHCQSLHGEIT